jgi:uncharacterized protein YbaP (TraB family)
VKLFYPWLFLCVLFAQAGQAQVVVEPWSQEAVTVTSKAKGPAMWRISKGRAEVWVIGVLPVMPKKLVWDDRRIARIIKGASTLYLEPSSTRGLGDVLKVMRTKGQPDKKTLSQTLRPEIYDRYRSAAARAGVSVKAYERDKPVWAGVRLRYAVMKKAGLTDDEPEDRIKSIARAHGVKIRTIAVYKSSPLIDDMNGLSLAKSEACLSHTLDDIDFNLDRAHIAGQAWARGDIQIVRQNYAGSAMASCLAGSKRASDLLDKSINEAVATVNRALDGADRTVVILSLSSLLRKGSALDRLAASGVVITSPEG